MTEVRYLRSPAALTRSVGDQVLLASADRDEVDVLSGTASVVWRLLEEPRTLGGLVEMLSAAYRAPRDVIGVDVRALLEDLVGRGWLERDGEGS